MIFTVNLNHKFFWAASAMILAVSVHADERIIPQGANVAPNGDRLDVTSKCLRLNGRALIPVMGEMHYSRVPRDEWAKSLATMKEGGVSIVSTYVFWNHHEWKEGEWDFSGNRDLSAFLGEVKKAGLWAVVRIGPWAHGECREGGFPDWLVDKAYEWANGDAKKARQILRSRDARFLGETKKLFERVHSEVAPHLWKNGGPVIGIQLENESRGPWPYYQALKKLALETGYDVPMYTRTGWPRLNGPETTFGELIPLYGDYAEGFWDRELKSMPGSYKDAFAMRPARTSSVIATEQLGAQKSEDAKGAEKYPYFTCELGGGMASSYHRRLVMEPMDAFALAVVKLGSGSNLPGFYMYHGGSNPTDFGVNMAESQRDRFTNWNDLPVVSYEFLAPISEFGETQYAYWMIKALAEFCRENAEELAVADPVFVSKSETRRGRFIFHNDYVRRIKPDGECWIGVEKDGKVERLLDGRALASRRPTIAECRRLSTTNLKLLKPAGTPPPVAVGPNGVAMPPEEGAWAAAAEYEVPFKTGDMMLEIAYDGDMARLYADGVLVQDDFWKGIPIRYALRRLPKGTKRLVLKVLPRGAGWENKVYIDRARAGSSADDIARYEAVGELVRDPAEKPVDVPKDIANQDRHHFDREGQRILGGRYYDAFLASAEEFRAPRLGVVCETPAQARPGVAKSRAWEQSLLTGNGAMGAMVPGELAHEEMFLSHARLFLPRVMKGRYFELGKYRDRARELALAGREKEIWDEVIQKASDESGYSFKRDPFMGAVSLVVDTPDLPKWSDAPGYRRMTDFERGECTVRTDDYERRIFASRTDGVIAMRVKDAKKRPFTVKLETISNGRPSGDAAIQRIREKDGYMYYRVDFRKENGKNPFHGYEAVGLRKGDEVFVKIYPLPFGTDSMFETAKRELSAAADTGYARLLERHAPVMKELMGRVTLDLPDRDLVRKFHAGRYNIISSTGPDGVLPNLQGLWAGSWSAPYNGSYTVDGNMPCAMSFWTRGNTPEFNESLYAWIMRYYDDFREAAKKGYNARGIHIPGQVTTTGLETAYYRNVELMWWHGGAGWMTGYLWRWYEATQDIEVLKKVYPLLKDAADYICDCMEEMPDGTLGFAPGYSPENAPHGDFRSQGDVMNPDLPKGGYSTMNNPTMDISVAKQSIDYATKAAKILKRDEGSVREWAKKRARLPKYAVSKDGFWAEWLIPGTPDNNSHRHASHVYALYDEAPAEILTNAAFVAAIKKTLDARMTFHERENHMAFGVTQIGYAAAKVGDAAVMERAIKLLQETYFTDALGTLHDPGWLFNIDISGGFPGIIVDALITKGPDGGFQVLNAKPASWKKGSISGLLLPGGIKVKNLSWQGDSYELELLHPDGRITVQRK